MVRHVENPKSPTSGKGKRAASTPKVPVYRGRPTSQPARSGQVTVARATSVPDSQSQQASPTWGRSSAGTYGRADNVSSNYLPPADQVRPNATTHEQETFKFESIISGNKVEGSATQINSIIHREKNSSQAIQDLKLTKPHRDRANIENDHSDVCKEHLRKLREHSSYRRWKDDDEIRLLWIYSHSRQTMVKTMDIETGHEKRIVAVAVAKELEESPVVRNNALSYMFCRNSINPEKLNDTAAILRGLLWLLSLTQDSLTVYLEKTYNHEGKSMYTDEYAKGTLSDILLRWLGDTNVRRVYLVVGAIDECYIERKDILEFLKLIIMRCKGLAKVKWLITSDYDDIYIDWIKWKLGPDDRSFETIHLNEGSKTLQDPRFGTIHLKESSKTLHNSLFETYHLIESSKTLPDPSFEAHHPNKGSNMGRKAKRRARNLQRQKEVVITRGTRGTGQQMKHGGARSAQVVEGDLDKRKGGASDTIPEESVEEYDGLEKLFDGGAGENKDIIEDVSGSEKDEGTTPLTEPTPSPPLEMGKPTSVPQPGSVSEPSNLNVQKGSTKWGGCCCVVQ